MNQINQNIEQILKSSKKIAVVGVSKKEHRPSHSVTAYLIENRYEVFPVNPQYETIFGRKCYSNLDEINEQIEIVVIFRRPEEVLPIVEQVVANKIPIVWMQLGVINEKAAEYAVNSGLKVVMDRCIKIEHSRLL